ncbi:hypothetical protein [Ruegeria sp. 6PALISEP08]|uniref:hypothetical protein n=1 Tax=Ruegeria sp. 6PALISEP08 TaxID=1225660 RepID=UPI00155DD12B|nr:hypothetical protein [Ruegeria sp. 6PALISEP08]
MPHSGKIAEPVENTVKHTNLRGLWARFRQFFLRHFPATNHPIGWFETQQRIESPFCIAAPIERSFFASEEFLLLQFEPISFGQWSQHLAMQTNNGSLCFDDQPEHDAYKLTIALRQYPPPQLATRCLVERWRCSRSSVERFRKLPGLKSVSLPGEHPCFDLLDVLRVEEVDDPILLWAFDGSPARQRLSDRSLRSTD